MVVVLAHDFAFVAQANRNDAAADHTTPALHAAQMEGNVH
jgi:hypothetical protein